MLPEVNWRQMIYLIGFAQGAKYDLRIEPLDVGVRIYLTRGREYSEGRFFVAYGETLQKALDDIFAELGIEWEVAP